MAPSTRQHASAPVTATAHAGERPADQRRAAAHPAEVGTPSGWAPHARIALAAFAALTLLPMLGLAALAFAGGIDGAILQDMTPALMLLPALVAVFVWSVTRPHDFGDALRLRAERGWLRAIGWSLAALPVVALLGIVTAGAAVLLGVAQPGVDWQTLLPAVPSVFTSMLLLALAEEVGWRGFAQRLLAPVGVVRASLAIAAFWALWHTPAMAIWVWEGTMPVAVAATTLSSLLLGGLVLSALAALGGSVWPAVVGHAAMNSLVVFTTSTLVTGDAAAIGAIGWLPWALAAVSLLLLTTRALRGRRAAGA
ncbi:CPBP family intramembrane glutamic endopeptidase [Agrococcus sp. ARC_14]|uniref:CPBP family intramembrane glutamic endopeptidase n=1 Tax=Agrococcus sp. ARC_14 TaxID=2919927 RepID=UPI001F05C2F3|nr:CPBP family intramembrane glutamic endopeptidase [Agrococcus sp. ARC_14]MCH1881578.1 CPBP family intramembrane metalloprotease [Agrococcus sp. ARC_14]